MAKRYGQFTLLEDLGRSETGERFRAMHDTLGGPFFVKRFTTLEAPFFPDLQARCDRLMLVKHDALAPHLGHGEIDGVPFAVSTWLEGADLNEFVASLKDRRVTLGVDAMLFILRSIALAVETLHRAPSGQAPSGQAPSGQAPSAQSVGAAAAEAGPLTHGDVTAAHIRVGPEGEVWLTGLATPRGLRPGVPAEAIWDGAGVAATVYDLIGLTRPGPSRPPLPPVLDRLVRRGLGIGSERDRLTPREIAEGFDEVGDTLKVSIQQEALRALAQRTVKAIGRRASSRRGGADALPTLEPIGAPAKSSPSRAVPASIDLEPVTGGRVEVEARTEALPRKPTPAPEPLSAEGPHHDEEPFVGLDRVATQPIRRTGFTSEDTGPEITAPMAAPPPVEPPPRDRLPVKPREVTAITSAPVPPERDESTLEGVVPEFVQEQTAPEVAVGFGAGWPPPAKPLAAKDALPPDIPLDDTEDRITRIEFQGLGASLLSDPAGGASSLTDPVDEAPASYLRKPIDPLDDPTREVPVTARESITAPVDAPPAGISGPTRPAASSPRVQSGSGDQAVSTLLRLGRISDAAVADAVVHQSARGGRLVEILIAEGVIKESEVADALAEETVKPRLSDAGLMRFLPDKELLRLLPQTYAVDRRLLPLALRPSSQLVVAMTDPFDLRSIREVGEIYKVDDVEVHVASLGALKAAIAEAYRPSAGAHSAEEHTVLLCVADDELTVALGARLAQEGFTVEHAADGNQAKTLLERYLPDAVVAAANLPGRAGTELLVSARAEERHAETPFFVFGPDDEALEARVLDLGGDDYFETPLNLNVVIKKLRRSLQKRPKRAPAPLPAPSPFDGPAGLDGPTTRNTPAPPPTLDTSGLPFEFEDAHPAMGSDDDMGFAEPTGVMGTLKQMAVSEIVQSLELGRKTARVDLVPTTGQKGSFSFRDGQVVYAECGDLLGEDAFYQLARVKEGFFRIHYGDAPSTENVQKPTTFLLLEAMRLMDEETNAA